MFPRPPDSEDSPNSAGLLPPGLDRTPYITWLLIGANVIVYLLTELKGGSTAADVLLRLGAMESWLIASGEYWRLFIAMFLHSGLIHLGSNLVLLLIFGHQMERVFRYARFIAIYILAGLSGSVASYAFNISVTPYSIAVGASGAVFGILGALVAFFMFNRNLLGEAERNIIIAILILAAVNLAIGFAVPGIDNFAHIGGLVGGFLLGLALAPRYRPIYDFMGWQRGLEDTNSTLKRLWVLPVALVILAAGVLTGDSIVGDTPIRHVRQAVERQDNGEFRLALESVNKAIEIAPAYGPAYLHRALIMIELGNADLAMQDLGRAVRFGLSDSDRSRALDLLLELRANR